MRTDVFLAQGNSHPVCQDYGIVGPDYVIISDGCSTAKDSDVGARLICIAAKNNIGLLARDAGLFYSYFLSDLKYYRLELGLDSSVFCATLLVLYAVQGLILLFMIGDGFVIQNELCLSVLTRFSFNDNTPFYPSYAMSCREERQWQESPHVWEEKCSGLTFAVEFDLTKPYLFRFLSLKTAVVATDGIASFQKTIISETSSSVVPIPVEEQISEMLEFKTLAGSFLQRRCGRVIRDWKKAGIDHYDDIAIGAIILEDE